MGVTGNSLPQDVPSDQGTVPAGVLGCLSEFVPVGNDDQLVLGARHGNVQSIHVEKTGGFLHKSEKDHIRLLPLTLVNRQDARLRKVLDFSSLPLKLDFTLLILVLGVVTLD